METLYDTLPLVPEGKQLSQLRVGLLMYSDRKYNLNLTGIRRCRTADHMFFFFFREKKKKITSFKLCYINDN